MSNSFLVRASETTTYYRGTKDISAFKLDHGKLKEDGVWGPATYLSPDLSVAKWYAAKGCEYFGIVSIYQPSGLNLLEWSDADCVFPDPTEDYLKVTKQGREKLDIKKAKIKTSDMVKLAKSQGYDGIDIKDDRPRYGEPMLVLWKTESMKPKGYLYYDITTEKWTPVSLAKAKKYDAEIVKKAEAFNAEYGE